MTMTESEAEAALRKMASGVGDPLGGVLRSLLDMLDTERATHAETKAKLDKALAARNMRETKSLLELPADKAVVIETSEIRH